jgi:hypothetical protein
VSELRNVAPATVADLGPAPLRLELAEHPDQLAAARQLRNSVYHRRLGLDLRGSGQEGRRDRAGHVFLLLRAGTPVASGRAVPVRAPECELRELGHLPDELAFDPYTCEVGRIATTGGADPGGVPYSAALLCLGARWLTEHTPLRRYVAYCRTPLLPLYQAVGALDLRVRFRLDDRGGALYGVVVGDLATPAELAAAVAGAGPVAEREFR